MAATKWARICDQPGGKGGRLIGNATKRATLGNETNLSPELIYWSCW